MFLHSQYHENTKRKTVREVVADYEIERGELDVLQVIEAVEQARLKLKHAIPHDDVKVSAETHFDGQDDVKTLTLYFMRPETDEEYESRMRQLKWRDLTEVLQTLAKSESLRTMKDTVRALITDCEKYKIAEHYKPVLGRYFNTTSEVEALLAAEKRGYERGNKEGAAEMKKKLLEAVTK